MPSGRHPSTSVATPTITMVWTASTTSTARILAASNPIRGNGEAPSRLSTL